MTRTPARLRNARGRPQPHRETLHTTQWCEECRRMHEPGKHACRHDYRDGDVCVKCDKVKR